jgi:nucleoside-diphosphate-sugar epimerase
VIEFAALRISMVIGPGAANTATPWRSEIFEMLRSAQPVSIHLPYARGERLPLIHVMDVAEMIGRLVSGVQPRHVIYNAPSHNWQCGDLADTMRSLNPNITVTFGPSSSRGDPEAIDGKRFTEEFGLRLTPIEERLRGGSGRL